MTVGAPPGRRRTPPSGRGAGSRGGGEAGGMKAVAAMRAAEAAWMELKIDGTVTIVGGTPIDATAGFTLVHPLPGGDGR